MVTALDVKETDQPPMTQNRDSEQPDVKPSSSVKRQRYSPWVKEQVRRRYRLCRTTEDKLALAEELGIVDDDGNPSLSKLY